MSTPVDVLAVMDREARVANAYRLESGADVLAADAAEDAAEARAAVAELIAADEAVDVAELRVASYNSRTPGPSRDYESEAYVRHREAKARRYAAMLRVKGGAA